MKIAIEVKKNKNAIKPAKDNVIIYDGKEWYVTKKADLFKEYEEKFADKLKQCDEKIAEINDIKVNLSRQMLEFKELIETVLLRGNKE